MPRQSIMRQRSPKNATACFVLTAYCWVWGSVLKSVYIAIETPLEILGQQWGLSPLPPLSAGTLSGLDPCRACACCHRDSCVHQSCCVQKALLPWSPHPLQLALTHFQSPLQGSLSPKEVTGWGGVGWELDRAIPFRMQYSEVSLHMVQLWVSAFVLICCKNNNG